MSHIELLSQMDISLSGFPWLQAFRLVASSVMDFFQNHPKFSSILQYFLYLANAQVVKFFLQRQLLKQLLA
jgi:hypothetical protein